MRYLRDAVIGISWFLFYAGLFVLVDFLLGHRIFRNVWIDYLLRTGGAGLIFMVLVFIGVGIMFLRDYFRRSRAQ